MPLASVASDVESSPLLRNTPTGTSAIRRVRTASSSKVRTSEAGETRGISDSPDKRESLRAMCQKAFGSVALTDRSSEMVMQWPGGSDKTPSTRVIGSQTEPNSRYEDRASREILSG